MNVFLMELHEFDLKGMEYKPVRVEHPGSRNNMQIYRLCIYYLQNHLIPIEIIRMVCYLLLSSKIQRSNEDP